MGRISLFLLIVSVFVVGAKRKISSEVQDDERHRRCSACKAIQNAVQEDAVARLKDKPNWSAARRRRAIFMSIEESCVNLNGFVSVGAGKEQRYMRLSDAVGSGGSMAGLNLKVDDQLKDVCAKVGKQWRPFIVDQLANAKRPSDVDLSEICEDVCDWVD